MIKTIGSVPVKSRVPLAAWSFAGILTLLSIVSSLVQVAAGQGDLAASGLEQVMTSARYASLGW